MWQTLVRARRRIARSSAGRDGAEGAADAAEDLSFALGRVDLERLIGALEHLPDREPGRPDTPARLEAALHVAITGAAGRGVPTVTRRPAGVYTPEMWQIDVADADARTRALLDRAVHGGKLA